MLTYVCVYVLYIMTIESYDQKQYLRVCVNIYARASVQCIYASVFTSSYVYKLLKGDRIGEKFIANPWPWPVCQYFRLNVIARNPKICYSGEYSARYRSWLGEKEEERSFRRYIRLLSSRMRGDKVRGLRLLLLFVVGRRNGRKDRGVYLHIYLRYAVVAAATRMGKNDFRPGDLTSAWKISVYNVLPRRQFFMRQNHHKREHGVRRNEGKK